MEMIRMEMGNGMEMGLRRLRMRTWECTEPSDSNWESGTGLGLWQS